MSGSQTAHRRRTVLKAAFGAAALVPVSGRTLAANERYEPGDCVSADPDDGRETITVYSACDVTAISFVVDANAIGVVRKVCERDDGRIMYYVEWDGNPQDGWAYERNLTPCVEPY